MSSKYAVVCIHLLTYACASGAFAGTLADVQVIDRVSGETLPQYRHHGKLYVAGSPGTRYSIQVRNKSNGRIMGIVSVDGVNAVSGATADTL